MLKGITDIFVVLVAVEALGIMFLEMFGSQTHLAQKGFELPLTFLRQSEAKISMANQGLYNGFIGVGILVVRFSFPAPRHLPGAIIVHRLRGRCRNLWGSHCQSENYFDAGIAGGGCFGSVIHYQGVEASPIKD
ncbi:hypothetical protein HMPREF9103_01366 [Lentilactobacillus parafarraginis F0439]|uniref:DUF1304 domain-containing protein n=1 Tax=Lentilactobacillus parafarraginis F0439 TaxID=797515 RepID=G9ZNR2_9LACO|nr:hypothetical protein HMPREF9103_01366 [Lentilactobacillus parafarraginis F0439]